MHTQFFQPAGTKYDWVWVVAMIVIAVYRRNNLEFASKYIPAKDDEHARKSVLIPLIGYTLLPIIWFIPCFAAHTLVPSLMDKFSAFSNPQEASYIATCLAVAPQGMLGLVTVSLFAATMSSMDTGLNKAAGFFIRNFYLPVLRKKAEEKELLKSGQIATAVMGFLMMVISLILATMGKISLFEIFQMTSALLVVPTAVPLLLGMFFKNTPKWSVFVTVIVGFIVSALVRFGFEMESIKAIIVTNFGADFHQYAIAHKFSMTVFFNVPLLTFIFIGSKVFYKNTGSEYDKNLDKFFNLLDKPVDFEKEVGHDNSADQARILGILSLIYSAFIFLFVLIPNSMAGRLSFAVIALILFSVGMLLYKKSKTLKVQ